MQNPSDGMVSAADIVNSIDQIKRGEGEQIMARLCKTEPQFALYIETIAAHLTNPRTASYPNPNAMADVLDRILSIVRAMELGHYRMWKDAIPPSSPLARLMDPGQQNGPKSDQKNK
jgi:hypothetical protein